MSVAASSGNADLVPDAQRLLAELSTGAAHLPLSTKVAIAAGSLRVRIARSSVTMTSIVLAIAFLVYMGTINAMNFRLAAERDDAINILLYDAGVNIEATLAGNPRDRWLIVMALLTCTVGIANAMLMSVAERFREIGTMKCLGATDGLVVHLFLLESLFLGLVGTIAGEFLGVLVAGAVAGIQYGGYTVRFFPWSTEWTVLAWGVFAGVLLSVVGAVGPAWKAARMQPVEALRVEELTRPDAEQVDVLIHAVHHRVAPIGLARHPGPFAVLAVQADVTGQPAVVKQMQGHGAAVKAVTARRQCAQQVQPMVNADLLANLAQ